MPRYCAVKVCRNRRGSAFKQHRKRISFYPFPLHDKTRLQQWVNNMKRTEWTPSRHQFLCSEHFTDDCFDIRWGIRYLKNTAIPHIFPLKDDVDKDMSTLKIGPQSLYKNTGTDELGSPLRNGLLPLNKPCKETHTTDAADRHGEKIFEPPLRSHSGILCLSTCEVTDDSKKAAVSQCSDPLRKELADPAMTVPHNDRLCPFFEGEADVNTSVLEAPLSRAFIINPVVMVMDDPTSTEGYINGNREQLSMFEHSYSRPDTDKCQLWRKIFSLHAKLFDLDRREESTVAKIHALETEISQLKRDSAVCKEKQKMFEDIITSKLL